MDPDEERDLRRLAEAVADGADVDWNAAGSAAPELSPRLEGLRAIAEISHWCHRVGAAEAIAADDAGGPSPAASGPQRGAPACESEPTMRRWGPLVLHECMGSGSFAEVYRATDPLLARDVALKLFKPERVPPERGWDSVLEEARRLAQVRHPNVILVHGADVHAGRAGLWTELLQGETLEQSLERQGPYSADEAALVGAELCAALAAIHAAGLVHGDVTTRNVMRVDGGRIVLMDFGSAHETVEESALRTGTPLTLAPEVLVGGAPSRAADVYQLGVLLYRLTSRTYPVEAASMDDLLAPARQGRRLRDRRADLPAEFVQVVECALEAEPSRRFESMGEMERALRATLGTTRPAWSRRRRRRLTWTALLVLAVAGGFAGVRSLRGGFAAAPPHVQAALFRVHAGLPEPIDARARLQPGDALFMTVESREDLHLYVFNEATNEPGALNPLFPDPGLRLQNPLLGGVAHRLPASSAGEAFWQASPTGGTERILVVATRARFEALEALAAGPHPQAAATPPVDEHAMQAMRLRAIRLQQPPPSAGSAIDALMPQLEARRQHGKDIWFELIQIEPEPSDASSNAP